MRKLLIILLITSIANSQITVWNGSKWILQNFSYLKSELEFISGYIAIYPIDMYGNYIQRNVLLKMWLTNMGGNIVPMDSYIIDIGSLYHIYTENNINYYLIHQEAVQYGEVWIVIGYPGILNIEIGGKVEKIQNNYQ